LDKLIGGIEATFLVLLLFVIGLACPVGATPPPVAPPPPPTTAEAGAPQAAVPSNFLEKISRSQYFLGDMWGLRKELSKYGTSLFVSETSEILGNATGGTKRGADYDGLTQVDLQTDTQRACHHYGGLFNASVLQVHGTNLSADNLQTLQTSSGIEADRATRLWELWYQQKFLEEDRLDVKIGQQSLDQEFMVSQNALLFVNTMFGWAMVPSADLPGGGPAYPLSALGIRFRARPNDSTTVLAGVYNGSPVDNNSGDPQRQNPTGTTFGLKEGTLVLAEAQFAYPGLGAMVYAGKSPPLPRVLRLGAWYDTQRFADEQFSSNGLSLANPLSSGTPRTHDGNASVYAVYDQMVWNSPTDYEKTLNIFGRLMVAPQEDRNLVGCSANAGIVLRDPFLNRDDDSCGLGIGYARVGDGAADLDRETGYFTSTAVPVRTSETFIEATYQYAVNAWFQVQPDLQYVINPGGGILNPNSPGGTIANELVIGTRINILF
jgi:porin